MRKALLALLLVAAVAPFAGAATISGLIQVQLLKYEPYPAEPGGYVDVWISVANTKTGDTAENVQCGFKENYPFSLDSTEPVVKQIGNIKPGYEAVVSYNVRVDDKALPGNNTVKVICNSTGYPNAEFEDTVLVQPHDAVLAIESVATETVAPGARTSVKIRLKNMAGVTLKDISVKLDLSATTTSFAPVGSASEKRLATLAANEETEVSFDMLAYPSAQPGVYKIPLNLTYRDRLGATYTKTDVVGMVVDSPAKLDVDLESSEAYKHLSTGSVTITVINAGLSDVKSLVIKALPSNEYVLLSAESVYIGGLSSDDSNTADYKLYVNNASQGNVKLLLELSYIDAFNQPRTEARQVTLPMYSQSEIAAMGIEPIAQTNMIMVAIIALVALYIAYKVYKRFKKK